MTRHGLRSAHAVTTNAPSHAPDQSPRKRAEPTEFRGNGLLCRCTGVRLGARYGARDRPTLDREPSCLLNLARTADPHTGVVLCNVDCRVSRPREDAADPVWVGERKWSGRVGVGLRLRWQVRSGCRQRYGQPRVVPRRSPANEHQSPCRGEC
jgi:hypothetical protein